MNAIHSLVESLEKKILLLKQKMDFFSQENQSLQKINQELQTQNETLQNQLVHWKQKYEALKLSNAISGSEENKTDTKIKINALIREIDSCIAQLSDN